MVRDERVKFDPKKHHRKSTRLKGYDYCVGAYFVTIVTYERDRLFGKIENGEMTLNDFGKIADECWRAIHDHFPFVELGAYVVMPNHVHGVLIINDNGRDTGFVGARHASPLLQKPNGTPPHSLGAIVGSFKSAVTKRIGREHKATGIWQRNYHEHIIRDEREMDNIWRYIENNSAMWAEDEENP
jgi:putative transposase